MAKAEVLKYTDKDLACIEALKANKGVKLSAKELGFANGTLTSLIVKAGDPRPMVEGQERVFVNKETVHKICPECGAMLEEVCTWDNPMYECPNCISAYEEIDGKFKKYYFG